MNAVKSQRKPTGLLWALFPKAAQSSSGKGTWVAEHSELERETAIGSLS